MTEFQHQSELVRLLHAAHLTYCASIAGANLSTAGRGRARAAGYIAGEPDLRIYNVPPALPGRLGTMVEMKTPKKRSSSAVPFAGAEAHQRKRLAVLEALGWHCIVGFGVHDALRKLREAGYPLPRPPEGA